MLLAFLLLFPAADLAGVEFFESKVRPVLIEQCAKCHGDDPKKLRGGLNVLTADILKSIAPGKPSESLLIKAINHEGDLKMPSATKKLPADQIAALTKWVAMGAPLPDKVAATALNWDEARKFWSFQPVRRVAPPAIAGDEAANALDRFLLAKLQAEGISPAPLADRVTLIRRVTFGLTGLPPTPEEVDRFVNDSRPDAYERLVDRLLASPAYGEKWARHWLDVARYAEDQAHTFAVKPYTNAWRYRDWVIAALNDNIAYDRFVKLQIAADLMPGTTEAERAALGFFGLGVQYYRSSNPAKSIAEEIDDRVDTLTRGFLGLTVACARCHDHKFDPIPTADYYSLAGVFHSSRLTNLPVGDPAVHKAYEDAQKAVQVADKATKDYLKAEKLKANEVKKWPADKQAKWKELQAALDAAKKAVPPPPPVIHGLAEAKAENLKIALRGDPLNRGMEVPRRFLRIIAGDNPPAFTNGSGRLELAEAIAAANNPLTARVMVNRLWQQHFGRGIVGTPSNFGMLGEKPTHPELLDWLAQELIESGWDLKHVHRLMVTSTAYQRSSVAEGDGTTKDPDNQLLWRANRRRLQVEAWRDSLLAVSGTLQPMFGGPTFNLSANSPRRTVYAKVSRHELDGLLRLFDFPDANITAETRTETTVPQQQLFVLNSPFFLEQARALAGRLQREATGPEAQVQRAYRLLYGRAPLAEETEIGLAFLRGKDTVNTETPRLVRYAQALLASNEFIFID
jgi:mono/diheme cytochrome c family protein